MRSCADGCGRTVARRYAKWCDSCRWKHRRKRPAWVWTPERDAILRARYVGGQRGIARELAAVLGFPRWVVTRRAQELGLARPADTRRVWSEKESVFLTEHAGTRTRGWIARKLGRSLASVALKARHEGIRLAVREGYTMRELELCFGEDHKVIRRWMDAGKLRSRTRGYAGRDALALTDADVWAFITSHPGDFSLRRVDQAWFMDLVISRGGATAGLERLSA